MAVKINRTIPGTTSMTAISAVSPVRFLSDEAEDFFARLDIQPTEARMGLYTTLINNLVGAGIWAKLDVLYVFAADHANNAVVNLIANTYTANSGSMTFTTDQGYTGTGTAWVDTTFVPSTAGGFFSQDDAHMGVWINTDKYENSTDMGTWGSGQTLIRSCYGDLKFYTALNAQIIANSALTTSLGHFVLSRGGSATYKTYIDGVEFSEPAASSQAVPNKEVYIGAYNGGGVGEECSTRQYCVAHIGGSLTDTEITSLHSHLRTYLQAVGALDTGSVKRAIADHPIADYTKE